MANTSVVGRVVFAGTNNGIQDLTVTVVDFDPCFNEDDVLARGKTDVDGTFLLTYSPDAYKFWKTDREPDLVVRIYGPRYSDPKLFGTRLLHETKEEEDVTDATLDVGVIQIHPDNIDGWLVTHVILLSVASCSPARLSGRLTY